MTDTLKIVVFGANGPTGRLLVAQALAAGHTVTAVTRHPAVFPLRADRLRVFTGDVFDLPSVDAAVAGQDAVLSTLGQPFGRQPIAVYSKGVGNMIRAMHRHGVRRLAAVSSSATEPHDDSDEGFLFQRVIQPFVVNVIGRTLYEDMRRMEALMLSSGLDWTIVRPSGLFETPSVTAYRLAEDHLGGRFTARADLANCLLRQATDDEYVGKALAVRTVEVQPSFFGLLWREGISPNLPRRRPKPAVDRGAAPVASAPTRSAG